MINSRRLSAPAAHVGAAMAILWACAQVVTSWPRLRLVAALAHGLLMVYIVQAVLYKYVELPATLQSYEANKAEFLHERGWKPDEFLARQFEKKLMNGEMVFFTGRPIRSRRRWCFCWG